uniref:Proteoglycan 4a n=1 Tax=Oryzias latipes TaxID=8090 RepID=A0A3P9IHQ6_ORYLA
MMEKIIPIMIFHRTLLLCVGRCGEAFTRGQPCTCDFGCMQHNECCPDFEASCTAAPSCRGHCDEPFRRGRPCDCDRQCVLFNTCCHDYQLHCDMPSGTDLCSDPFIDGLTALNNGTVLIFKGELFWSVEPVSHSVGSPQRITETLGIPSPIDTAFTRTDCNRNTYIIKDQYWQFDGNMVMKPGFPKPLNSEFPGLTGSISAALAVPATSSRAETVFFFKKGEFYRINPFRSLKSDALLSAEINIRVSLKAFPTPVTAALSIHTPQGSDRYQHFIFSGRKASCLDSPSLFKWRNSFLNKCYSES